MSFTRASNSTNYSNLGFCAFQWFVKPYAEFSAASSAEHLIRNSQLKIFTKKLHTTITVGLTYMAFSWQMLHTAADQDWTHSLLSMRRHFIYKYHHPSDRIYHFLWYYTTLSLSIHYFCSAQVEQHSRIAWLVTLAAQYLNPSDKESETILQWAVNWDRSFCFVHKVPFWSSPLKASCKRSHFFTLKTRKRRQLIHKINWWP